MRIFKILIVILSITILSFSFFRLFLSIFLKEGGQELQSSKTFSERARSLFELMLTKEPEAYKVAQDAGLQYLPTADGKSFYAYWVPEDFDPEKDGFVVALHGHDGFVSVGFGDAWKPFLDEHRYGYIGIQWWFGEGETSSDYYSPQEIYAAISDAVEERHIPRGNLLLEGFSRGSANIYAVKAIDAIQDEPLFLLTVANAGGAIFNYPPTKEIIDGEYGDQPFLNTHWVFFCGALDTEATQSGCERMRTSASFVEGLGGINDLFIEDPQGTHGGFHLHPENTEAALAVYEQLRAGNK